MPEETTTKQEEMITIPKKDYDKLVNDSAFLEALKAAGVDNWDGYDEAHNILDEWNAEAEEANKEENQKDG